MKKNMFKLYYCIKNIFYIKQKNYIENLKKIAKSL